MRKIFFPFLFLLGCIQLAAQKKNASFQLHIHKTSLPLHIDGIMDEAAWKEAEVATGFYMVLPMDTSLARVRTDVRMTYDNNNLYLIALCYHALPGPYYVESLRRDFVFGKNDNFLLFMDPFEDQTNGFSFGANAAGAQWDGTMYGGGSVDLNWDNKWLSAVKNDPDKWVLEMAIPFTTLRYKKQGLTWGINFSRLDLKTTEKSSWAPVPRQFPTASLAYTGELVWDGAPPAPGANLSLIPYLLGGLTKNYEGTKTTRYDKKAGADIKLGLGPALNLDLTFHPDFSQVEVDRQVINLDRYELFFPEKRQFFLENADLFANFGYPSIRPFFSRRIGLDALIQAGVRLSGRLNRNWRLGLMDMQTAESKVKGLSQQNFSIFSLQRRVFNRSNIGFLFVNRQSLHALPDSIKPAYASYNRNIGLEYNLASSNNFWTGKGLVLRSFTPGKNKKEFSEAAHLQYNSRKWIFLLQEEYVGRNYAADAGYVPRKGYVKTNPVAGRLFFPKSGSILSHGPNFNALYYFDEVLHRTDHLNTLAYSFNYRSQSVFSVALSDEYVKLLFPFDPTNNGKDSLAAGTEHHWKTFQTSYVSKPQSLFTYSFSARYGSYYLHGKRLNLTTELGYRFQPIVSLLFNASYNDIDLSPPWNHTVFWLLGSKIDVTLTNTFFFSTYLQYNEQLNNLNLNARIQWRYKPASDLFIVYTDNYFPYPFSVRNRALVVKLNYWWNR